jgi:hypothetical protein
MRRDPGGQGRGGIGGERSRISVAAHARCSFLVMPRMIDAGVRCDYSGERAGGLR